MAVSKVTCPECKTVLKPAKPLAAGKAVKCPECGTRFTVAEEAPAAPLKKPKQAAAVAPADDERKPKKSADGKKPAAKKPAQAPVKPAAKKADDEDEDGGIYGYVKEEAKEEEDKPDIEYAPDMSIKDLRGPAASALVQPSNALIAVSGLGFFGWVAFLLIILIPKVFPIDVEDGDKNKPAKAVIGLEHGLQNVNNSQDPTAEPTAPDKSRKAMFNLFGLDLTLVAQFPIWAYLLWLLPIFVGMVYSALVAYGAVKIQNLEGYGWGIASSIMVMLPVCIGGLMATTAILVIFLFGMVIDDVKFLYGVAIFILVVEKVLAILVGVWTLLTLLSEKVVKGYEYKAE